MAHALSRSQSQTSWRLSAWASWTKCIVPRWLSTEKSPGFKIDSQLPGGARDDVTRNALEHLPENMDVVTCWLGGVSVC